MFFVTAIPIFRTVLTVYNYYGLFLNEHLGLLQNFELYTGLYGMLLECLTLAYIFRSLRFYLLESS